MKLLHITATHLQEEGGIPAVLKNIVNEQNKIEHFQAKVLCIKKDVATINNGYFYYHSEREKIKEFIKEFSPNIVIIHSIYFLQYGFIASYLHKNNILYLVEPHGSFGKQAQNKGKLKKKIANYTVLKKFIKNAYGYIFLNEQEKKDSIYQTKKDLIIPNGITLSNNMPIKQRKMDGESDRLFLYFLGRFDINHKGIDILFDAIDILDTMGEDICIDFYGSGSKDEKEYMKLRMSRIKNLEVHDMGPVYGQNKEIILSRYDAMILTSRYEGFPMTILEALSYGNPCIVTPGTNVTNLIRDNNIGEVTDNNPKNIAETIIKFKKELLKNQESYIKRCQNTIADNFLWNTIAQRSFNEIHKLLN